MRVSGVFPVVVVAVSVLAFMGCGGGAAKPPATPQCVLASDCKNPSLQCAQGYCVNVCNTSVDCPSGQRCIATETGTTCQPPEKKTCGLNSDCSPLFCALDLVCRNECSTDLDCPGGGLANGQKCTVSNRCVDPVLDKNYDPATNELKPPGSTGSGGSGSGTGGRGGNIGSGGSACVNPQTQFGNVAKGDANPRFNSGVGVRAANRMIIFSAYEGPPADAADAGTDAAVANVSIVYAQAFDLNGDSLGPAAPLFPVADAPFFHVQDVSVAPTGEIVLLHSNAAPGGGAQIRLQASFLSVSATGDAGVAGLQVVRTVQLESVQFGSPHVIWSVTSQAFVISWRYYTTNWFTRIRKLLPNGAGAGGDTSVIPTPQGYNNDSNFDDTQIGTSGKLFASAYRHYGNGDPYMTILDTDGVQVGDFILLSALNVSRWVATGGTTNGFVALWNTGGIAYGVFLPTTGAATVLPDGGALVDAGVDAGDAGAPRVFEMFMYPTTATTARMISDDTGGAGGVGTVLLEANGTNFLYVMADGSRRLSVGTVISSAAGVKTALTNYRGSFGISLYESTTHATQIVASGCGL